MKSTYEKLGVRAGAPVEGEEVVVLAARIGVLSDMYHVSRRTYLVVNTEKGADTMSRGLVERYDCTPPEEAAQLGLSRRPTHLGDDR